VSVLAAAGTAVSQEIDPRPALQRLIDSPESDPQWKGLSLLVSYHRERGEYGALTQYLEKHLVSHPGSAHGPLVQEWIAANYRMAKDYSKSIAAYGILIKKFGSRKADDRTWAARALQALVDVHIAAGDQGAAIAAAQRLLKDHSGEIGPAWARYRLAKLYVAAGQTPAAIPLLEEIGQKYSKERAPGGYTTVAELAQRDLDLARSTRKWIRADRTTLAEELARVLADGDVGALARLASPTRFHWSVLGREPLTRPFKNIEPVLRAAWKANTPRLPKSPLIKGSRAKAYVMTTGWHSPHLTDTAWLLLTKTEYGWEWNGVVLQSPKPLPSGWASPSPDPPSPDLRFDMMAPWRDGISMLSGDPDAYIDSTYTGPDDCVEGLGWPGYYYGDDTHQGEDYFAIDFSRWELTDTCCCGRLFGECVCLRPCDWRINYPVGGDEVRSVAPGTVVDVDDSEGRVVIQHLRPVIQPDGYSLIQPDGYSSKYLHMRDISVGEGHFVARGSLLGYVDDMGDSTGDHLHFVLYDKWVCDPNHPGIYDPAAVCGSLGQSVRPSPLDTGDPNQDTTRGDHGDLKCIRSYNADIWVDADSDHRPNVLDNCPNSANSDQADTYRPGGSGADGIGDACENVDADQRVDGKDNCPLVHNDDQRDLDGDGQGDACDADKDGDTAECTWVPDSLYRPGYWQCPGPDKTDNCPDVANPGQEDMDGNGKGDVCDDDIDGDGIVNSRDLCPRNTVPADHDSDADDVGDICDNCLNAWNPYQQDANGDGEGDECDSDDTDGDGRADKDDNCPLDWENLCPVQLPPPRSVVTDFARMDFIAHTLQDRLRIPVGPCPGPLCSMQAELTFLNFPGELKLSVVDSHGREIAARRTVAGERSAIAFGVPAREAYQVIVSPGPGLGLGRRYEFGVRLNYRVLGGAPREKDERTP
jgi:tetratricopeptide (TPR) repeat protein